MPKIICKSDCKHANINYHCILVKTDMVLIRDEKGRLSVHCFDYEPKKEPK